MAASKKDDDVLSVYKEPPKNLDAEGSFIGSLLLDGKLLSNVTEELGTLDADEFFSEKNRIIYNEILERTAVSYDFNPTVICASLEQKGLLEKAGGLAYVASLTDVKGPTSAIVEYAKIIRDTSKRRRLISVSEYIEKLCYRPEGRSVEEIYDEAQGLVFELSEKTSSVNSGPKPMTEVALNLINKIKEDLNSQKKLRGIATGFTALDELTSGLQGGSLNILAARPGVGKTSFAMNIIANIATNPEEHRPALVFSLEMPADQIAMRMLSSFGRVSMKDLAEGRATPDQWHNIIHKVRMLTENDENGNGRVKLYIDDTTDIQLTPLELRSRARKIAQDNGGLSCIMVDYIQLMKGQTKQENRSLEVGEISRSLKQLAKELDVPIIALSQLNRDVEARKDHRPLNSDLRESGSLEQDADMIMFIHRESLYTKTGPDSDENKAVLIVSKNRHGAVADINLQFQGAYTTFYNEVDPSAEMAEVPPPAEIYQ